VDEALMIEPTETESPETIGSLADALIAIADAAQDDPAAVQAAPGATPIGRPDDATAARNPILTWSMGD
jgi:glycine dehydrogenase subunit 2